MSELFDRLARMAAGGVSRRDSLKYLGGLLAGGFLAGLPGRARADDDKGDDDDDGNEEINERCQKFCKSCRGVKGGVHGKCIHECKKSLRKNPKEVLCGKCTAKNPFTACSGAATCCPATAAAAAFCANLNTDVNNCGKCGNVCKTGAALQGCCSGTCTDLTTSTNCGACGKACASGTTCKATTTNGVTTYSCQ